MELGHIVGNIGSFFFFLSSPTVTAQFGRLNHFYQPNHQGVFIFTYYALIFV